MNKEEKIEALREGRNRLARYGLWKSSEPSTGRTCVMLASLAYPTHQELWKTLGLRWSPDAFEKSVKWNDAPERTLEDVLDVYDRTIARLERPPWYRRIRLGKPA